MAVGVDGCQHGMWLSSTTQSCLKFKQCCFLRLWASPLCSAAANDHFAGLLTHVALGSSGKHEGVPSSCACQLLLQLLTMSHFWCRWRAWSQIFSLPGTSNSSLRSGGPTRTSLSRSTSLSLSSLQASGHPTRYNIYRPALNISHKIFYIAVKHLLLYSAGEWLPHRPQDSMAHLHWNQLLHWARCTDSWRVSLQSLPEAVFCLGIVDLSTSSSCIIISPGGRPAERHCQNLLIITLWISASRLLAMLTVICCLWVLWQTVAMLWFPAVH